MKRPSPAALAAFAALLTVIFATAALTQTAPAPAPLPAQPAAGAYQVQGFAPGFDDLMTMLVQPRHIKLYYAGSAKNWELAAAESRDLRAAFDRIAQTIPNYEGNDVRIAIRGLISSQIDAVDAAVAKGDPASFTAAYQGLTDGCNACHTYMEHPFLVIKNPPAAGGDAAHSDQDFNPRP